LGFSSLGFLAGSASVSYQTGAGVFTLRGATNSETLFGGDEVWDTALLYGFSLKPSLFHVSAGIGIAVVGGWRCETCGLHLFGDTGNDEKTKIGPRIGLPLELQVFFRPLSFLGIGLYGFADINAARSFAGVTFCLQIGKLR